LVFLAGASVISRDLFAFAEGQDEKVQQWFDFLTKNQFDASSLQKIDMKSGAPVIFDKVGNKFCIDFVSDRQNYHKKKGSLKTEMISKAMGAGRYGLTVLDLSAGLGIDAVFLAQMGYSVTAVERHPLIYLALTEALIRCPELKLRVEFGEASSYLKKARSADVIYFDPMFPQKAKSALPRQEMVFFKNLVGADEDADEVLAAALKNSGSKRVVVKRPLKAPPLVGPKVQSKVEGKLIRFDIYGVKA
jgi:16S rRNA (guanine1516-N2)-methyltransferase